MAPRRPPSAWSPVLIGRSSARGRCVRPERRAMSRWSSSPSSTGSCAMRSRRSSWRARRAPAARPRGRCASSPRADSSSGNRRHCAATAGPQPSRRTICPRSRRCSSTCRRSGSGRRWKRARSLGTKPSRPPTGRRRTPSSGSITSRSGWPATPPRDARTSGTRACGGNCRAPPRDCSRTAPAPSIPCGSMPTASSRWRSGWSVSARRR
jgi:hypothetical protein